MKVWLKNIVCGWTTAWVLTTYTMRGQTGHVPAGTRRRCTQKQSFAQREDCVDVRLWNINNHVPHQTSMDSDTIFQKSYFQEAITVLWVGVLRQKKKPSKTFIHKSDLLS